MGVGGRLGATPGHGGLKPARWMLSQGCRPSSCGGGSGPRLRKPGAPAPPPKGMHLHAVPTQCECYVPLEVPGPYSKPRSAQGTKQCPHAPLEKYPPVYVPPGGGDTVALRFTILIAMLDMEVLSCVYWLDKVVALLCDWHAIGICCIQGRTLYPVALGTGGSCASLRRRRARGVRPGKGAERRRIAGLVRRGP